MYQIRVFGLFLSLFKDPPPFIKSMHTNEKIKVFRITLYFFII